MFTVFGLGNPGEDYEGTRHNSGRAAVLCFAEKEGFSEWKKDSRALALVSSGALGKNKVKLVLPETFMNKSGKSVSFFVKSAKAAGNIIVAHDDLDLPLGLMRISFGRGSGGHKGVESVMRAVKTPDFIRLRIGISREVRGKVKKPSNEKAVQDFVLGKFDKHEKDVFKKTLRKAALAARKIIEEGKAAAMNEFN